MSAEDVATEGLLLSKHMLLDHLPDRTLAILTGIRNRVMGRGATPSDGLPGAAQPTASSVANGEGGTDGALRSWGLSRKRSVSDVRSRRTHTSEHERLLPLRDDSP